MKTQVNFKIDKDVKKQAQKRAKEIGLSLSSVVNATLKKFAKTGELELYPEERITPRLEKLVLEARKDYKEGKSSSFDNVEDLIKHLKL
ncbi:type II toxin-antitoxin system RelB/DinJ family antitoxin [Candidatus Nomurabacteria bacterium]|nr:type II toxin-antitoxin system RelB/DinJ family antitoxin [Candidatus Nomurabacteria bacterium]